MSPLCGVKYAFLGGSMLLIVMLLSACMSTKVRVEDVKEMFEKELASQASHREVLSLLDSKGISHTEYFMARVFDVGKDDYVEQRLIQASIRNAETRWLTEYSIYLRFYFDEYGRLEKYTVTRVSDSS
jgi:hypothetical protein